jgi:hypothetical protein
VEDYEGAEESRHRNMEALVSEHNGDVERESTYPPRGSSHMADLFYSMAKRPSQAWMEVSEGEVNVGLDGVVERKSCVSRSLRSSCGVVFRKGRWGDSETRPLFVVLE